MKSRSGEFLTAALMGVYRCGLLLPGLAMRRPLPETIYIADALWIGQS